MKHLKKLFIVLYMQMVCLPAAFAMKCCCLPRRVVTRVPEREFAGSVGCKAGDAPNQLAGASKQRLKQERRLWSAVKAGEEEGALALLRAGTDVGVRDQNSRTLLHIASWQAHMGMVDLLLKFGAEVNARDRTGLIPLHLATARSRHINIIALLLHCGAEIDARNIRQQTPLHCAAVWGQSKIIAFLLARGADPCTTDCENRTPLQSAATSNYERLFWESSVRGVRTLLEHGASMMPT